MCSLLALSCALFFLTCSKSIDPNDGPRVELDTENVGATEVWLRVKFVNVEQPWEFRLERDGKEIAGGRMQRADTLVIDTTVQPKRVYSYRAYQLRDGRAANQSVAVPLLTLDTTSHAIQWQVDTLGARGEIFDVWAFSKDNIWAVGEVFARDADGKVNPELYNLAKWNGQSWVLSRIAIPRVNCIFALGTNEVWAGTSAPYHWDGQRWTGFNVTGIFDGYINKMWGTSSSNLFMVGTNGSIAHYNGSVWRKIESGTTVDLQDIWGIDEKHVWATGTDSRDGRSVVLQYNGSNWLILYDNAGKPSHLRYSFSSIWPLNHALLLLGGSSYARYLELSNKYYYRAWEPGSWVINRIAGTAPNDIMIGGEGSELMHYNGSTWYLYSEVKAIAAGSAAWHGVRVRNDLVVVGGGSYSESSRLAYVLRARR